MKLFSFKKNKTIDVFASNIANELFSVVQPQMIQSFFKAVSKEKKIKDKQAKKIRKSVETNLYNIVKQIQQFRATHSLGTYGKARLQLGFNERLKELGYDSETVKKLNEYILIKMP